MGSFGTHWPLPPGGLLHHWDELHCASLSHPVTQRPLAVLQMLPVWPWQSESVAHLPHCPCIAAAEEAEGLADVGHASEAPEPLSPLQGTQVDDEVSQTGAWAPHWLEVVHCTQWPLAVLQTGVGAEHCESIVQPTQVPLLPQRPERHTLSPLSWRAGAVAVGVAAVVVLGVADAARAR